MSQELLHRKRRREKSRRDLGKLPPPIEKQRGEEDNIQLEDNREELPEMDVKQTPKLSPKPLTDTTIPNQGETQEELDWKHRRKPELIVRNRSIEQVRENSETKFSKATKSSRSLRPPPLRTIHLVHSEKEGLVKDTIDTMAMKFPRVKKPELTIRRYVFNSRSNEKRISSLKLKELPKPTTSTILSEKERIGEPDIEKTRELSLPSGYEDTIFGQMSRANVSSKPVVILLEEPRSDSYVASVALMARELYRIRVGGKPTCVWLSPWDEDERTEVELDSSAEGKILVIDLLDRNSTSQGELDLGKIVNKGRLERRLKEMISQDYGFIIINYGEEKIGIEYPIPAKIIKIRGKAHSNMEKEKISSACWTFSLGNSKDLDSVSERVEDRELRANILRIHHSLLSFDQFFLTAEKRFYERMEKLKREYIEVWHHLKLDDEEGEEHKFMKLLTVLALSKEKVGLKEKDLKTKAVDLLVEGEIETEHEIQGQGKRRSDVYVKGENRYLEIETFYGTGDPIEKLDGQTLRKYLHSGVKRVDVILLGVHILLYLRDLLEIRRVYREKHGIDVNFFTLDSTEIKLVPLNEFLRVVFS